MVDDGRIVAAGTPRRAAARAGGLYAELYRTQFAPEHAARPDAEAMAEQITD